MTSTLLRHTRLIYVGSKIALTLIVIIVMIIMMKIYCYIISSILD